MFEDQYDTTRPEPSRAVTLGQVAGAVLLGIAAAGVLVVTGLVLP